MSEQTEKSQKPAMPFVRKTETRVLRIADRIRDYRTKTTKFESSELDEQLKIADTALRSACSIMASLPDDVGYKTNGGAAKPKLDVGSTVEIREARRKHYEGILADEDMVGLCITKVSNSKVVAETVSGTRLVLARGHVAITAAPEEPTEEAEEKAAPTE